jgi:ABC-type Zn2+ transport system substrate-binding protein/surface adhesin
MRAVRATKMHFYVTFAEIQSELKRNKANCVFQEKKMRFEQLL